MRLPFPISIAFFFLAFVGYLLQLSPLIGVFLMLFAAPYWSVLLINAGFVGIAVEAGFGLVHRLWLALPILWFGIYAGFVGMERLEFRDQAKALTRANAAALPNPRPSGIVIEGDQNNETAIRLMAGFTGAPLYTADRNGREVRSLHIGTGPTCATYGLVTPWRGRAYDRPVLPDPDACVYARPLASLPGNLWHVIPPEPYGSRENRAITIRNPSGEIHFVTVKSIKPLPWIPRPIMGCALISSSPEWKCVREFDRNPSYDLVAGKGGDGVAAAIATAFGLTPRTKDTPVDAAELALNREISASASAAALQALEQSLSSPFGEVSEALNLRILRSDPNSIRPYLPALVRAVTEMTPAPLSVKKTETYVQLIAAVPDRDFAPFKAALAETYRPGSTVSPGLRDYELMGRLGVTARRQPRASRDEPLSDTYVVLPLSEATRREQRWARSRRVEP